MRKLMLAAELLSAPVLAKQAPAQFDWFDYRGDDGLPKPGLGQYANPIFHSRDLMRWTKIGSYDFAWTATGSTGERCCRVRTARSSARRKPVGLSVLYLACTRMARGEKRNDPGAISP